MSNIAIYPPSACAYFGHSEKIICLPKKGLCDNTVNEGIFVNCGEQWNCTLKCIGDSPYFIPVPSDGTFMIQTNFNPQGATGGFGDWIDVVLIDSNGNEVEVAFDDFVVKHITGKSKKHHYQTFEVDVSGIEIDCFGFKIIADDQEICTQYYKKENCKELVEIEGVFTGFDCWNNYYGSPVGPFTGTNFNYSNKIYIKGLFKYFGGNVEIDDQNIKEFYRVHPSEKIAPFMMKYILNKVLASKNVKVNGVNFKNEGSGNYNPINNGSTMFFPILEFYDDCGNGNKSSCD